MAQIYNDKKRRIYRPEITIEYESITQIPIILLIICRFGIRKMNFNLMCGEYKYLDFPSFKSLKSQLIRNNKSIELADIF